MNYVRKNIVLLRIHKMYETYLFKVSKNNKEKQKDIRKDILTSCG